MDFFSLVKFFWVFGLISLTIISSYPFHGFNPKTATAKAHPFTAHSFTRFTEVEKACKPFLSSSSSFNLNAQKASGLKFKISFHGGNWEHVPGNCPLLPFEGSSSSSPLHLASFDLIHLDSTTHLSNAVNASGALTISMSSNNGNFDLVILFQGIYTESEQKGEMMLCLLGNSARPSHSWKQTKNVSTSYVNLPFVDDDQILLLLRYPMVLNLTKRGAQGELKSLNDKFSPMYFDEIHLSSQLNNRYNMYQFASEELVSISCGHCPYQDDFESGKLEVYKGDRFGPHLNWLLHNEVLKIFPGSTDKIWPFELKQEIRDTNGGFANFGMVIQDIRWGVKKGSENVRISAVFRVIDLVENQNLRASGKGFDGTTISAEGVWSSSKGQLCMLGCLGLAEHGCLSRICLYVPNSFSITQRSIIIGSIASINETDTLRFLLSFELPIHPLQLFVKLSSFRRPSYKYSKINLAKEFMQRREHVNLENVIKKSLLSYPKMGDDDDELVNLSILADDLTFGINQVGLEILSLGSLCGRFEPLFKAVATKQLIEKQLLNVSAELTLSGKSYGDHFSVLYVEGLYNQVNGKMYLIGCRDVRASRKRLLEIVDHLEGGFDCLIEVKVKYPPRTALWWAMNPKAKISITSKRNASDQLYFSQIKLRTHPIWYREHQKDIRFRRETEGIFCILTLSVTMACIINQFLYIRGNTVVLRSMSLVMLGVQAVGFSTQLIAGLVKIRSNLNNFQNSDALLQINNNIGMILLLIVCLLTLRLYQKVWKLRTRLHTGATSGNRQAPNDTIVLAISLTIHFCGYLVAYAVHQIEVGKKLEMLNSMPSELTSFDAYAKARDNRYRLNESGMLLMKYIGLVQDFFLLPQIIGNYLWWIDCKPLSKVYYIGITMVRLLPHAYDFLYIRLPGFEPFNPYFSEEYLQLVNTNLNFYSNFGDVVITMIVVVFSVIVFIQQARCYEQQAKQRFRPSQEKLKPFDSRVCDC